MKKQSMLRSIIGLLLMFTPIFILYISINTSYIFENGIYSHDFWLSFPFMLFVLVASPLIGVVLLLNKSK